MFRLTPVVKNLLIINVLFFLPGLLGIFDTGFLALYYPTSESFQPFQLATHFFMHGGIGHIFFNMFALVMFGSILEMRFGPRRFLMFYFLCAIGAAALHLGWDYLQISQMQNALASYLEYPADETFRAFADNYVNTRFLTDSGEKIFFDLRDAFSTGSQTAQDISLAGDLMRELVNARTNIPVVGASGAIYGLLIAFGFLYPNQELMLIFLPIPIKAKFFIPVLIGIELYMGFEQFSWDPIAHFAHLGGALVGFIIMILWRRQGYI